MRDFRDLPLALDRACASSGVGYALIGGMAVNAWGQPRNTADIDVLVDLVPADIDAFVNALRREGLEVSAADLRQAFEDPAHVTVFTSEPDLHLDLKLARRADEKDQVRDAVPVAYGDGAVRVARPEDTVAFKLKFGSPQDLADARGILVRQEGRLDLARLQALAMRLGVTSALDRVLREVQSLK